MVETCVQGLRCERLLRGFERLPAGEKAVHQILNGGGPSNHVLAGDILAPENNLTTSAMITSFLHSE